MVTGDLIQKINAAYFQLETRQAQLVRALLHESFDVECGWYNGHYSKTADGDWRRDSYPIPVISVKKLCDIELQFDRISVSTKLKKDAALACSFDSVKDFAFEAYGVEDYLADFYHSGHSIQHLKDSIRRCSETEIGFSFSFPTEAEGRQLCDFAALLKREGFYY